LAIAIPYELSARPNAPCPGAFPSLIQTNDSLSAAGRRDPCPAPPHATGGSNSWSRRSTIILITRRSLVPPGLRLGQAGPVRQPALSVRAEGTGESSPRHHEQEPRPFEPRFLVHPPHPDSRTFSQIPLRSWCLDPVHVTWACNQLILSLALMGAPYPNHGSPGSSPTCLNQSWRHRHVGMKFLATTGPRPCQPGRGEQGPSRFPS